MIITNPATGDAIAELADTEPTELPDRLGRARLAQKEWAEIGIERRLQTVVRFRHAVSQEIEHLAEVLTGETGKPIRQARAELDATLPRIDFFLEHATEALADEVVHRDPSSGLEERISHEPLGVVGNISAWNYPWFVGTNVFVPALIAGNAVLYKPSEFATLTGAEIARLWTEAGVPEGVFQTLVGGGPLGRALVELGPDGLFFTGSFATGRAIAQAYGPHMGRLQLELGGKDPAYVAPDADVAVAAASLADGAFYNNGQSCCSVERIYVHETLHDTFVEAFVEQVDAMVMGDPTDGSTYLGPLTRSAQLAVLEAQVADATARGATLVRGGNALPGPGAWMQPTVFTGVDHSMALMRDESFGPLIGIQSTSGDEQAVELMDDTEFGLTAGVFTPSQERAEAILSRLDVGSAYWNCCDRVSPRLPWSGRRHSGVGSTLSVSGITAFSRPKGWHLRAS